MKAQIEITDTFGGEANYSWVRRHEFDCAGMTDRQIERHARALVGLSGVRCRRDDFGDMITWYPRGACVVAFLTFSESGA
jgi:hypothetical protein